MQAEHAPLLPSYHPYEGRARAAGAGNDDRRGGGSDGEPTACRGAGEPRRAGARHLPEPRPTLTDRPTALFPTHDCTVWLCLSGQPAFLFQVLETRLNSKLLLRRPYGFTVVTLKLR